MSSHFLVLLPFVAILFQGFCLLLNPLIPSGPSVLFGAIFFYICTSKSCSNLNNKLIQINTKNQVPVDSRKCSTVRLSLTIYFVNVNILKFPFINKSATVDKNSSFSTSYQQMGHTFTKLICLPDLNIIFNRWQFPAISNCQNEGCKLAPLQ